MTEAEAPLDALAIIEEEARAVAKCFGMPASSEVAAAIVDRLRFRLAGQRFYVRSSEGRERAERLRAEIRAKFTGANLPELSIEYGMTQRHLRRFLFPKPTPQK